MNHCRLDFYCVGCHPEVFEPVKAMPALAPFTHDFTISGQLDPAAAGSADVILADLRDTDAPGTLQSLLSRKKENAQLILLADLERFKLTADQLDRVTDLWVMPMTEDELRFRFLRWQQTRKLSYDYQSALAQGPDADQAAKRARNAFFGSISHDIRTPVNAIMGIITLLRGDAGDRERVLEYTKQLEAFSHHLLSLINDVLDMNKLESGTTTLNLSEVRLADLIDEINAIIRPQVQVKEQTFEIRASSLTHECLVGDPLRINQILINILSNAVKYTQKGGLISMTVTELPKGLPGHSRIRFVITDNGQGMSEDYQKMIFEPFSREKTPANRMQGTGLGMAITKNLVDLMGGSIQVESQPGQGSTITVELELRVEEKEKDPRFWENHGIRRMIVADDDEYVCRSVLKSMSATGVEVEYTTRGSAAAKMIRQAWEKGAPYDLLLLDWKMPELDGLETARLIRAQKDSGKLPILLFTAYDWSDIKEEALEVGISHFLPKPFFMISFQDAICRVMAGRGKPHWGEPQAASPPSSPNPKDVLRGKHVLVVDDIEVNRIILTKILTSFGAECDTAENGQIAVDKFLSSAPGEIDLIMMDIQMPVMDGYTASRTIRASDHPSAQSIPVVAITANALVDDVRAALKAGMDAHIAKPVVVDKLLASLRDVFAQRKK